MKLRNSLEESIFAAAFAAKTNETYNRCGASIPVGVDEFMAMTAAHAYTAAQFAVDVFRRVKS